MEGVTKLESSVGKAVALPSESHRALRVLNGPCNWLERLGDLPKATETLPK